jgi:hypothetical protein
MHDAAGLWRACMQVAPVGWRGGMHVGPLVRVTFKTARCVDAAVLLTPWAVVCAHTEIHCRHIEDDCRHARPCSSPTAVDCHVMSGLNRPLSTATTGTPTRQHTPQSFLCWTTALCCGHDSRMHVRSWSHMHTCSLTRSTPHTCRAEGRCICYQHTCRAEDRCICYRAYVQSNY